MNRRPHRCVLAAALLLSACAVGRAAPDGAVWGLAIGNAELRSCSASRSALQPDEPVCSYIRGGAISPEGAKAIGPAGRLLQLLAGLF